MSILSVQVPRLKQAVLTHPVGCDCIPRGAFSPSFFPACSAYNCCVGVALTRCLQMEQGGGRMEEGWETGGRRVAGDEEGASSNVPLAVPSYALQHMIVNVLLIVPALGLSFAAIVYFVVTLYVLWTKSPRHWWLRSPRHVTDTLLTEKRKRRSSFSWLLVAAC